jgi:Sensors of blue-light using FAD
VDGRLSIQVPSESVSISVQLLEHIIYASVGTQHFGSSELAELLQKSRASNERLGLTGMLLHCNSDGSFFQVLEGEPAAVDQLFQKILLDKRHSHVTLIIRESIAKRSFAEWSMGFSGISQAKLRKIPGFNDFFRKGSSFTELDPGRAKKLLVAFSEGYWRPKHLGATWTAA